MTRPKTVAPARPAPERPAPIPALAPAATPRARAERLRVAAVPGPLALRWAAPELEARQAAARPVVEPAAVVALAAELAELGEAAVALGEAAVALAAASAAGLAEAAPCPPQSRTSWASTA